MRVRDRRASNELLRELVFLRMLKRYGMKRVVLSLDGVCAFAVFVVLVVYGYKHACKLRELADGLALPVMQVAASFLGIIIAVFAISAGVSDRKFAELLERHNLLRNLLFPFWLSSVVWFTVLTLTLLIEGYMIVDGSASSFLVILTALATGALCFALIASIRLVGMILRLAVFRALLSPRIDEPPQSDGG